MAEKKNINQDRDNGIWGELLTQQDNTKDLDKVLSLTKPDVPADGGPAQSFWSTGRKCPKCKGALAMKELTKTGFLWVFCKSCGSEYVANDLENTSDIGDKIHRQIPDDTILKWMAANDLTLRMQGK